MRIRAHANTVRDTIESRLQRVVVAVGNTELKHGVRWLFYCAIVGVVAGTGALLFDALGDWCSHLFLERLADFAPARPAGEAALRGDGSGRPNLLLLAVAPALGGLLSGLLVTRFAPEAAGHGTDAAIEAYHHRGGYIRPFVPLVKIVASAITLGSGGSGGREGPIAQTGAGFGSFIATRLRLSHSDRRVLMAAGMGAGIGSIFRAPLAGALFASEILYRSAEFEASVLIPACVSSIVAYCTFTAVHGTGTLFATPTLRFSNPAELLAYLVLAIVLAAYGLAYVRTFYGVHRAFERLRVPRVLKPALGGLLTGGIAVLLLHATGRNEVLSVLSVGYGVVQQALDSPETLALAPALLALVAFGKILTTSCSIGSGGSAGVFGPSMVIGGCAGGAVGLLLHRWFPEVVQQPGAYVIVGMAGFFAGVAKTPISTLVMVSEMTGSYSLLLPSLWVCVLTFSMSGRWNLYSRQVAHRIDSPAHQGTFARRLLRGVPVRDVVAGAGSIRVLEGNLSLGETLGLFENQSTLPVLDAGGSLEGIITLDELRRALNEGIPPEQPARDLMVADVPRIETMTDMAEALRVLSSVNIEELPVWDPVDRRVVGLLSRRRITHAYVARAAGLDQPPPV